MKRTVTSLLILLWLMSGAARALAQGNTTTNWQANHLKGFKEQISLPPEITAFIAFKEQQMNEMARKEGFEPDADFKQFFAAAKAGRARDAEEYLVVKEKSYGTNLTRTLKSPLTQLAVDVALAYQAFNQADADLVLALGNDLMRSLPAGCIYFGGTDVGRGLPTMLCKAPGDPIFVLSQNPLADVRYREYVRAMYGARIHIPTTNEFQEIIDSYLADAQRRWQHDQDFPKEPKQLRPGENVRMVDGKPRLDGVAVMGLNAQLAKMLFDKNPDREFYYEESSPLDWMYPYLSPHAAVMKINRQPLASIPADEIKADEEFWRRQVAAKLGDGFAANLPLSDVCDRLKKIYVKSDLGDFKGDARYIHNETIAQSYSKLRDSIAGIYHWRWQHARTVEEKQSFAKETELACRQAFALCPFQPGAVYRYVNFLNQNQRLDEVLLAAETAEACAPKSETATFSRLVENMKRMKAQQTSSTVKPDPQQQLKQLKADFDAGKIDRQTYEQKKSAILNSL